MTIEGRVALVTGAGHGLGRAHAHFLASRGAKLLVNDLSDAAEDVVRDIETNGGTARAHVGSVTDESSVRAMVADAMNAWGRVDILINNAGFLRDKSFANMSLDDFRAVIDVHLMGSVICTREVWPIMREQGFGRIVMTTSSSGLYGNFGQANYSAAKMALVGLMQTLAIEGEKHGIRVNCIAPTAATAMTQGILPADKSEMLAPEHVSPGLLPLVCDTAPSRVILCAGAGHFARANVTLTNGVQIDDERGDGLISKWEAISDRTNELVPDRGFVQAEREILSALRNHGHEHQ